MPCGPGILIWEFLDAKRSWSHKKRQTLSYEKDSGSEHATVNDETFTELSTL